MARIVGGNPFGFMSGKLGGIVFSHNKAGQYARQYVKPVDPKSEAQITARSVFAQAMSAFHTLSPTEKNNWQSFASSYFTSKNRGNVPNLHSGVNAFVALRNNSLNADRTKADESSVIVNINSVAATLFSQDDIVLINSAPTDPMSAVLDEGAFSISNITDINFDTATNLVSFSFTTVFNSTPSRPTPIPQTSSIMLDFDGQPVGFSVYCSNLLPQEGVFVKNPEIILLGSTGLIGSYTTPSVVTNAVDISFTSPVALDEYSSAPIPGGTYLLSLYMFNSQGQTIRLGSITRTL